MMLLLFPLQNLNNNSGAAKKKLRANAVGKWRLLTEERKPGISGKQQQQNIAAAVNICDADDTFL